MRASPHRSGRPDTLTLPSYMDTEVATGYRQMTATQMTAGGAPWVAATAAPPPQKTAAAAIWASAFGGCCGSRPKSAGETRRDQAVQAARGGYGAGGAVAGSLLEIHRPDLMHLPTTNGDHSQGDGIKAGQGIGAKCVFEPVAFE